MAAVVAFLSLPSPVGAQVPVTDIAMDVIVRGPTRSAADDKTLVAEVSNLGTTVVQVCDTDILWDIEIKGFPTTGTVSEAARCEDLSPGGSARFKATWTYGTGEPGAGAEVAYTATVSGIFGDVNVANDSDTELRVAK
jgi:hypothetical protein